MKSEEDLFPPLVWRHIVFIEDQAVIRRILGHLRLWEEPEPSPPPPGLAA